MLPSVAGGGRDDAIIAIDDAKGTGVVSCVSLRAFVGFGCAFLREAHQGAVVVVVCTVVGAIVVCFLE